MSHRRSSGRGAAWAALLLLACAATSCGGAQVRGSGSPPLDLALPRLDDGGVVDLETLRGRPLLLTVFATWSLQTDYELDQALRVAQLFGDRVHVLAVAADLDPTLVRAYVQASDLRLPVALLPTEVREGGSALGPITTIPRTVLLDAEGRVRDDRIGRVPAEALVRELEALLAEQ